MNTRSAKLAQIRTLYSQATENWEMVPDSTFVNVEAVGPDGELIEIAHVTSTNPADVQLIAGMQNYIGFLLDLLQDSFDEYNKLKGKPKPKQFAVECAMLCGNDTFKRFLADAHGLENQDKEAVETKVREILGINSRKVLDTDPDAASRWRDLKTKFKNWQRQPVETL